jgi:predicted GNAT superfamily acetyltransferase
MSTTERATYVRPLQTAEEYRLCEKLQLEIWQADPIEVAPAHVLITVQRHGGLLLGAFDRACRLVGFLFGFTGLVCADNPAAAGSAPWQHCSHMLGVVPEWRGRGVGYQLKLAQRQWAIDQGFELVTWTYDPLEGANAALNVGKLGAICRCYLRDFYGEMADGLNIGLPTDRFEVAWWVGSEHVRHRVEKARPRVQLSDLLDAGATVLNPGHLATDGHVEPGPARAPRGDQALVEIPSDTQVLKVEHPDLALAWRLSVRQACEAAFATGYAVIDLLRVHVEGLPRSYYLLKRDFIIT